MEKTLANIKDPTKKIAWLAEHVKTPKSLHEYGVLKIGSSIPIYGAVSQGILTAIDAVWKFAGWEQMLQAEAQALSFHKTWQNDVRVSLGFGLYVGALGLGVGNAVKAYGTWRNVYATGMLERAAGKELAVRAGKALRMTGGLMAALSGVAAAMDLVDAVQSAGRGQWALTILHLTSVGAGVSAAVFAFSAAFGPAGSATVVAGLSLTGWSLVLAVLLVALNMAIGHVRGDSFAQWLERCYWGELASGRYADSSTEQSDFSQAMAGA
jgi:hypothetical protein